MPHAGKGTWVVMKNDPLIRPVYCRDEREADELLASPEYEGYRKVFIVRKGL